MENKVDITEYRYLNKPWGELPNWELYKKLSDETRDTYLLYKNRKNTKYELKSKKVYYAVKWTMPPILKAGSRRFEFTSEKLQIGIFRLPLEDKGEKLDLVYQDPENINKLKDEELTELIDTQIVSLDANKIPVFCFELEIIDKKDLQRCGEYWKDLGLNNVEFELDKVNYFINNNYLKQIDLVKNKVKDLPDYEKTFTKCLCKKITPEEAEKKTNNVITLKMV